MTSISTQAILLHRLEYGDYDLIITFFTHTNGKTVAIAKSAKKSIKRFGGILQPLAILNIVIAESRGKSLPVLQEASVDEPFSRLSADIHKTAYASYWAEILNEWTQEGKQQIHLFQLLRQALTALDRGVASPSILSMSFQMKFLSLIGLGPNLTHCKECRGEVSQLKESRITFDIPSGQLICDRCRSDIGRKISLSKGTILQLRWMAQTPMNQVSRIRCLPRVEKEGLGFLETFLPYHLGKKPKSLTFLEKIRQPKPETAITTPVTPVPSGIPHECI